jgi:DNA repair protein RadC
MKPNTLGETDKYFKDAKSTTPNLKPKAVSDLKSKEARGGRRVTLDNSLLISNLKLNRAPDVLPTNLNLGHRKRLRDKFLLARKSLPDYEILEMLLFSGLTRKDTKVLAKTLLLKFGSLEEVVNADEDQLRSLPNVGDGVVAIIKLAQEIHLRILRNNLGTINNNIIKPRNETRVMLGDTSAIKEYCKSHIGSLAREQFLALFINGRGILVADEIIDMGNISEVRVSKSVLAVEAVRNAASSIIIAHNHPSGDPRPSPEDVQLTTDLTKFLMDIGVRLQDHIVVSYANAFSFSEDKKLRKCVY